MMDVEHQMFGMQDEDMICIYSHMALQKRLDILLLLIVMAYNILYVDALFLSPSIISVLWIMHWRYEVDLAMVFVWL